MAEWFRRKSEKIKTSDKREIAEGMWLKCPQCQEVVYRKMLEENHFICTNCTHHFRITSDNYIQLLLGDRLPMEDIGWQIISKRLAIFFFALALLNEAIWRTQSDEIWVFFKTFGLSGAVLFFMIFQYPILKKYGLLDDM